MNTQEDTMEIERLKLYKTAYSVLDKKFVCLLNVYQDSNGIPIIAAYLEDDLDRNRLVFREGELTNYCL